MSRRPALSPPARPLLSRALRVLLGAALGTVLAVGLVPGPAAARPAAAERITLTASTLLPQAGEVVKFTGRASRPPVRNRVRLQVRQGRSWTTARTARLGAGQRYSIRVRPPRSRTTVYRVVGTSRSGGLVASRVVRVSPQPRGPVPPPVDPPVAPPAGAELAQAQATILARTNDYRADAGLQPLRANAAMHAVAVRWSRTMAAEQRMYHNPGYATQIPAGWTRAGENVAYGYAVADVARGWYSSEGHRRNMLGDFTDIGIGWAVDADGRPYYTQVFARY